MVNRMATDQKNEMTQDLIVIKTVNIATSPYQVWRALTEPDEITQWMGGARVESDWEIGSDIIFTGTMPNFNKRYRDRGMVLAVQREKVLRYGHWSEMSRLPDIPQNRTIITFTLEWIDEKTRLTVRHENFRTETEYKHADFFWGGALNTVKNLPEQQAH